MPVFAQFVFHASAIVDGIPQDVLFQKELDLLIVPRTGDKISIQNPQGAIQPTVTGVYWHLPRSARIILSMARPITSFEIEWVLGDKWNRIKDPDHAS